MGGVSIRRMTFPLGSAMLTMIAGASSSASARSCSGVGYGGVSPRVIAARSLTMRRLYIESLQALLGQVKNKLILSPGDALDLTVLGAHQEPARPAPKPIAADQPQPAEPGEKN